MSTDHPIGTMATGKAIEIQGRLERGRERFLVAIETLPDAALLEPNSVGRFSIADLLANLTSWEAELVTGLMRLDQGKKPTKLLAALKQPKAYDKMRYSENKGRDLDSIFDDFQQVRAQLETWIEDFSDRDLTNPKQYKWFKGKSLEQVIAETSYEKETEYIPNLEAFARQWLSREVGGGSHDTG
jgi:hypothetical protein